MRGRMMIADENWRSVFPDATRAVNRSPLGVALARDGRANEIGVITGIRNIIVPAKDDGSRDQHGTDFGPGFDDGFADVRRWTEITPPSGSVALVLRSKRADGGEEGSGSNCAVFLNCEDFQRTHRDLTQRGVRFPAPPAKMAFGWLSMFEDDEGRRYVLGEW